MQENVEKLAALGLKEGEIAFFLGIDESTWTRWKKRHPLFAAAVKKGRLHANISVTKAMYNNAVNGNVVAGIFWLKNRAGWRDDVDPNVLEGQDKSKVLLLPAQCKSVEEWEAMQGKGGKPHADDGAGRGTGDVEGGL